MSDDDMTTVRLVARDVPLLEARLSYVQHIFHLLEGRPFFHRPDGMADHLFYLIWFGSMFKTHFKKGDSIAIRSVGGDNILDSRVGARLSDRRDRRADDTDAVDVEER